MGELHSNCIVTAMPVRAREQREIHGRAPSVLT